MFNRFKKGKQIYADSRIVKYKEHVIWARIFLATKETKYWASKDWQSIVSEDGNSLFFPTFSDVILYVDLSLSANEIENVQPTEGEVSSD